MWSVGSHIPHISEAAPTLPKPLKSTASKVLADPTDTDVSNRIMMIVFRIFLLLLCRSEFTEW
jgi:hypothetical protein